MSQDRGLALQELPAWWEMEVNCDLRVWPIAEARPEGAEKGHLTLGGA